MSSLAIVRKRIVIGLVAAALLSAGGVLAFTERTPLLAWSFTRFLARANDQERAIWADRVAGLGEDAAPAVLAWMTQSDEAACRNAGRGAGALGGPMGRGRPAGRRPGGTHGEGISRFQHGRASDRAGSGGGLVSAQCGRAVRRPQGRLRQPGRGGGQGGRAGSPRRGVEPLLRRAGSRRGLAGIADGRPRTAEARLARRAGREPPARLATGRASEHGRAWTRSRRC